jgi:hypothetical protein
MACGPSPFTLQRKHQKPNHSIQTLTLNVLQLSVCTFLYQRADSKLLLKILVRSFVLQKVDVRRRLEYKVWNPILKLPKIIYRVSFEETA